MSAIEAVAFKADGTARPKAVKLPAETFDGLVHDDIMHQAVKVFMANQRQGTVMTKTRGFVSGGNQKPWRQKGTGRARQGSTRAPNWPGGGTAFGPLPREYRLDMPQKMRRLARKSAFNARAREQALHVIAPLAFDEPKTKRLAEVLGNMGLAGHKVLVLTHELNTNVLLSSRNIPGVSVMRFQDASTYDILHAETIIVEENAFGELESGADANWTAPVKKQKRKEEKSSDAGSGKKARAKKVAAVKKAPAAKKVSKTKARAAAKKKPAAKKAAAKKAAPKKKK